MRRNVALVTLLLSLALSTHAQNIAGDWQGTLKVGPAELRLVLHLGKAEDGTWKAMLDSVDQGANGIPVDTVALKDSNLVLVVDAVKGSYRGKVSADANTISGIWTQTQPLPLDFKRATAPVKTEHKPAKPSDIDGSWLGTLDTGSGHLHIIFRVINTEDGLIATLDSPDQGAQGLPATAVTRSGNSLKLEWKGINGVFEGKIASDLTTIVGTWTQIEHSFPLAVKRVKDTADLERHRWREVRKPHQAA